MTEDDKQRIDEMTVEQMDRVFHSTPPGAWPFRDPDTGEYFCERFDRLKRERDGHLADPN